MTTIESLVKIEHMQKPYATMVGSEKYLDFEVMKFYEGEPKRLIAWVSHNCEDDPLWVQAAFTISEG